MAIYNNDTDPNITQWENEQPQPKDESKEVKEGGGWKVEKGGMFANRRSVKENGKQIFVIEHYSDIEEERERIDAMTEQAPAMYKALIEAKAYLFALLSWQTENEKAAETIKNEISKIADILRKANPLFY